MITDKRINKVCIVVIVFAILMTLLFMNGEKLGIAVISDGDNDGTSDSEYFSANDINASWSTEGASHITLNGTTADISGSGAYFLDGDVYIVQAGYYVISGELTDGSIIVEASSKSRVWIMLNQVTVNSSDDAAFRVNQAKKVFLTLADGTVNTFSDANNKSESAIEDGTNACIYVHDNLAVNGTGKLIVNGNYKNGITAKDNLVIAGGQIEVNSVGDGIKVNEKLKIRDAVIDIAAEDDGLVVDNGPTDTDDGGYLYMMSGKVILISKDDAINSAGDVTIDGGELVISAADDAVHSDTNVYINGGTILINECYEGIEALTVTMTDGDVIIYSSDDGINANGGSGDAFGMGAGGPGMNGSDGQNGGPGMNGDGNTNSTSGTDLAGSEEGRFGPGAGNGENNSSGTNGDGNADGTSGTDSGSSEEGRFGPGAGNGENNSSGTNGDGDADGTSGTDSAGSERGQFPPGSRSGEGMQPGMRPDSNTEGQPQAGEAGITAPAASTSAADSSIMISGGRLTIINSEGKDCDGLDSNGNILISGGDIRISLPGSGTNLAIDYGSESGGTCVITGGTVIACGGSEMIENFDETSTQCNVLYNFEDSIKAGSLLTLSDSEGNVLLEYEVPNSYTSLNISCPEMTAGNTYILKAGDTVNEITLENTVTTIGETSESSFGQGFGGMQPGDGNMQPGDGNFANTSQPGNDAMNGNAQMPGQDTLDMTEETEEVQDTTLSWAMIGASGSVMLLGLAFAMIYRRKEF